MLAVSLEEAKEPVEGAGYSVASLDGLGEGYGFRKIRRELGVTEFGVNAIVLPAGWETGGHYHERQQELYFLHSGRIEIEFGAGGAHELGPGGMARVDAATVRTIRNRGPEDAVYVVIGAESGYVGRDRGLGERHDEVAPSGGVGRVHDHRQVRQPLGHDDRREVQREARARLERADAALAEDHVVPTRGRHVLRRQQPLLHRRRETPLQDHAVIRARYRGADPLQKREVRHVAGPDLQDLRVLHDQIYVVRVHHLGYDLEAKIPRDPGQYLQALLAETLERVGRGAGFEGATANITKAGLLHGLRRGYELVVALDRARAGDHPEGARPDHAVGGLYVGLYACRNVHLTWETPRVGSQGRGCDAR